MKVCVYIRTLVNTHIHTQIQIHTHIHMGIYFFFLCSPLFQNYLRLGYFGPVFFYLNVH